MIFHFNSKYKRRWIALIQCLQHKVYVHMFKDWDEGKVLQFCAENTYNTALILCLSWRKIKAIHRRLYFELK
jgi:hypothetical protein